MSLTQAQINAGTGSQADQRLYDRQTGGGIPASWNVPYGEGADEAGAMYRARGSLPPLPTSTVMATYTPEELASFDYASLFGNVTPQARVNAGIPYTGPTSPGTGPAGGGASIQGGIGGPGMVWNPKTARFEAPPTKPNLSSPQDAGEKNSLQPGWSGGSQEPGQSTEESGLPSKVLDTRPATDPLNVAARGGMQTMGEDQGLPPPPANMMKAAVQPKDTQTGYVINYKGTAYTVGKPKPANFHLWDATRQQNWLAANAYTPSAGGGEGGTGDGTEGGGTTIAQPPQDNWGYNIAGQPPASALSGYEQAIDNSEQSGRGLSAQLQSQGQTYAGRVAYLLTQLVYGDTNTNTPGLTQFLSSGGAIGPNHQQFIAKATEMEQYLNSIGINWHPVSDTIKQYGGQGGGGGNGDGSTDNGGGIGGGDGGTGGIPAQPGSNTDVSQIDMDSAMRILNGIVGGGMNDPKYRPFLLTMAYAIAQQRQADANKQQGVNIYSDAINDIKNDPRRAAEGSIMDRILANPDPTPWDTVRDQTIADLHRSATAAGTEYQKNALRKLGPAGASAAPGVMADFLRQSGNETARRLGELEIEKARTGRDAEYRALAAGRDFRGSTTEADAERARSLAAMIAGRPDVGPNPIEGASDAWVNSNTYNHAANQPSGGGFGIEEALGAIPALFTPGANGQFSSSAAGGFTQMLSALGPLIGLAGI